MDRNDNLLDFIRAVAEAFPYAADRDRFGRYNGPRDIEKLRQLAVKYDVRTCFDTQEQAGEVARAILRDGGVHA